MTIQSFFFHDKGKSTGVYVTATSTHQQTFNRSQPHRSINTFAMIYGSNGTTVAYMSRNDLLFFIRNAQDFASATGNIAVACSMETVTAHTVFRIHLVRQTVHISLSRHCLVESRIEHSHLGNTRNQRFHRIDTLQVSRVMQRSQIRTFDYLVDHIPVDLHAGSELFTSMYHTMADSVDFVIFLNAAVCLVSQNTQDKFDTFLVAGHFFFQNNFLTVFVGQFQECTGQTDLFDTTLCHYFTGCHIEQFIFNRTTTAV